MHNIFDSVLSSDQIAMGSYLLCTIMTIILGFAVAWIHSYKNRTSHSFILTVALIPVIVEVIIMLVNGNLGAGVAVAGAFGFVRFRSAPGTAREISSLFLAMAIGFATGMGYLAIATMLVISVGLVTILFYCLYSEKKSTRILSVTVPEALDYEGAFEEVLSRYTPVWELISVKTISMGTMYRLKYEIEVRKPEKTKEFLDELRIRNGNMEVSLSRVIDANTENVL